MLEMIVTYAECGWMQQNYHCRVGRTLTKGGSSFPPSFLFYVPLAPYRAIKY